MLIIVHKHFCQLLPYKTLTKAKKINILIIQKWQEIIN